MSLKQKSQEPHEAKKRHRLVSLFAYLAGALLMSFIIFSVVTTNIQINKYQEEYEELTSKTAEVKNSNEEIQRYLEEDANLDEYIERIARDKLDYANPDERVYYIVPSS